MRCAGSCWPETRWRSPSSSTGCWSSAGRALTHQHLLQRVWGPDKGLDSEPVRNIVRRLRRKLGDDPGNPSYIFAEPSVGYRMAEGAETREATP